MMLLEIKEILNGDMYINFETYKCDRCGEHLDESMPRTHESNETHFCWDCSFVLSHINEEEYLKNCGITLLNMNAAVNHKGEIEIWTGNKVPPWERSDREQRSSSEYKSWREKVFKRDYYTCQKCNQIGGELNAHHIKPFAKYKKLRYEVSNGLTVCVECHREIHRKKR